MEKLIYTAVSGAELNNTALRVAANNLANVSTAGFKADMEQAQSMMVQGGGFRTRYLAQLTPVTTDLSAGPVMDTGRNLDIALSEGGYLEVMDDNGNPAYTRAGNLLVDADGFVTVNGRRLQGDGGDVQLPEFGEIEIGSDGIINLTPIGGGVIAEDARIKLASTDGNLVKGPDGLLRSPDLQQLEADETIKVRTGALEGSNVNAVAEMIKTMNISRQFEMNVKMMKSADELATSGNKLISERG
ncbi:MULTISPECIES: flagellar basal body rod protein FlgF [Pseudoalteromonas]|uniref:Flagellar basal-body rod protein FlgF n=2 Tax=Pseudoalteromonas aliena TaxID=247523 RepID=A0A1Q2H3I0_9GAMM|nr:MULTISPECIES: flagellar basal body rod protein FlgF [Pseudoalteromonas]AQP98982.1 flagellin biosynthesis protein FlgF [Pseudoalteromonas aliena]AQQ01929.1 flagellin biosynthesis protein FlgF [Pseudoalteromonas aliena]MBE0359899.1 flagellar basal-body rod protein FlgF [Pseudoalteromonas aliena SW19]TMO08705.1 flagellar basal body rod protein FlgF [Pseudoalteromonas sp. S558]